ncbi:MAG: asparagine synthase [Parcubacteria group bacterium GW2011_GWF2_44_17]|nr:MAG: asparagine synthase [Parcubacteria group bacterium GW2011_GWF2_44_17]
MSNSDKTIWIVFNGEIYNYRELKRELTALGRSFSTNTDTEVIIAAYETWGDACLQKFNGIDKKTALLRPRPFWNQAVLLFF